VWRRYNWEGLVRRGAVHQVCNHLLMVKNSDVLGDHNKERSRLSRQHNGTKGGQTRCSRSGNFGSKLDSSKKHFSESSNN
jgi:hypothetical protein